jgi:hypothetical protein
LDNVGIGLDLPDEEKRGTVPNDVPGPETGPAEQDAWAAYTAATGLVSEF